MFYLCPLLLLWPIGRLADRFGARTTMLMFSRSADGRSGEMLGLRLTANNLMRVAGPALFGLVASALGLASVFALNALMMTGGAFAARPHKTKRPG